MHKCPNYSSSKSLSGKKYLPKDCQFAVLFAAVLYVDHHRLIRNHGFDVLTNEPELGTARKLRLLAETRWHWFRTKDPGAVFYRVSSAPTLTHNRRNVGATDTTHVR